MDQKKKQTRSATLQQAGGTLQQAKRGKASEQAFAASDMHQCKWDLQRGESTKPMEERLENRKALLNVKTLENLEKLDNI